MALFEVRRPSTLSAEDAWRRLTDWPAHGRFVPFTTVTVTESHPEGVGTVFVARTALAGFGFDDPMTVVEWDPPADGRTGRCRMVKGGRVMLGWAELSVAPQGAGCSASWREEITVARLPRFLDAGTALGSRLLFGRVLRGLLA